MWQFFKEKAKFFCGGFIAGVFPAYKLLFLNGDIYLTFFFKCLGAIIIAILSGIFTSFGHEVYKFVKKKYKVFKEVKVEDKNIEP